MKRKILAGILTLTLTVPVNVFASEQRAEFNSEEYELAQNIMDKLEILEYSEGNLQDVISRVDFAVYLARLLKVNEYEMPNVTYYTDMPIDHYGLKCVNYLTEMGAFDGFGNSEFKPDDPISPIDAAKVIFNVLGYRTYATLMGGYTKAYYDLADDTELLKGFSACDNITRKELTVLLLRAGLTNIAQISSLEGENITFQSEDSETVFERYWDIYEEEGVVITAGDVSLSDKVKGKDGYVTLNDEIYRYEAQNADAILGRYVRALTERPDNGTEKLLYATVNTRKTEETYVTAKDIESYADFELKYIVDEKSDKCKVATDAKVVYNGSLAEYGVESIINNLKKGDIYLIDVTRDNLADTVIINEYETYVVGYIDKENEIIYDELTNMAVLNLENYTHKKFFSVGGGELNMDAVAKGAIINVKESNGTYADIYISNATVSGKVLGMYSDEEGLHLKIDDTEYTFDENYTSYGTWFENGVFKGRVGESFTFKLDMFGEIAYISGYSSDTKQIGYIIDIKTVHEADEYVKIKVIKSDGGIATYQTAEKTEVDGIKYKNVDAIANAIANGDGKVIGYKANEDGKITFIDTTYKSEKENDNSLTLVNPVERESWEPADSRYPGCRQWFKANQSYSGIIMASTSTVVFVVPEDASQKDEDYYGIVNWSTFEDGRQRKCASYKFGEENFFDDVIVEFDESGAEVSLIADLFVINGITQELNADDEVVYRLDGFVKGKQTSYVLEEICMKKNFKNEANSKKYTDAGQLSPGSIAQLTINSQGKVSGMRLLVDYNAGVDAQPDFANNANYGLASSSYRIVRLFCNDRKAEGLECSYFEGGVTTWKSLNSNPTVTVVDTSKKKDMVSTGTLDDILTFKLAGYKTYPLYAFAYRYQLRDVIVYK